MTKEARAKIARENGAKSKGPKTEAGKARSARNALKDGARAKQFACFTPPHEAVLCNESRKAYIDHVDDLIAIYKPLNQAAYQAVGDMANARWQIERLNRCITMHWNLAIVSAGNKPPSGNLAPELRDLKTMVDASAELLAGNNVLSKLNREIARLHITIGRAERRIKFIHAHFPDFASTNKQTEQKMEENVATEEVNQTSPEESNDEATPIFTSENTPSVIAAYRKEFPGRRIVIDPPENVGFDDKMPRAPRRAA